MTQKELLDLIWEQLTSDREALLKDWDHYANIGDFIDAKKAKGGYDALTKLRDFIYAIYRNPDLYK